MDPLKGKYRMLELNTARKHKINLQDYNSQQDIENRILIADFSFFEHEVLQEIFFSPLKFSVKKLARNLDCHENDLSDILDKLSKAKLLTLQGEVIFVDKEMRKYFEFHMMRFSEDFKLDMVYLQGILRKIPIHILPTWYAIPRTSNNIFESIVEKYLDTPQIYQRHLSELSFTNAATHKILEDVLSSPNLSVPSSDLITKYNLSREAFEEIMLSLEYSFAACLTYSKGEDHWIESVTPFHEWKTYLNFFKETKTPSLDTNEIELKRKGDFAFAQDLSEMLSFLKKQGYSPSFEKDLAQSLGVDDPSYISRILEKATLVQLLDKSDGVYSLTEASGPFLEKALKERAYFLYSHPLNKLIGLDESITSKRKLREAEKSIKRVLRNGWVLFDDFLQGTAVSIHESANIKLTKQGKNWNYTLPEYSEEDLAFLKTVVLEWLFEAGIVQVGTFQGKNAFRVTDFGRYFFEE